MASFLARVEPGRLIWREPQRWRDTMSRWIGKTVRVWVTAPDESKQDLFGYYYSTVLPEFAEWYGADSIAEMHTDLKTWFAARVDPDTLELVVPSLADLTVGEMTAFVERVLRQAALNGWHISEPRAA